MRTLPGPDLPSALEALLWDADGVLLHGVMSRGPQAWAEALDALGGPGMAAALDAEEAPALRGEESLRSCLRRVLDGRGGGSVEEVLRLWDDVVPDAEALAMVDALRAGGLRCYLATNQQDHRRELMRDRLDLDAHFDDVFYSCELGVAKPDPAFFETVLSRLGLPARRVGFVDDSLANVIAAQEVGLVAVHHDPAGGGPGLRSTVARLLLSVPGTLRDSDR